MTPSTLSPAPRWAALLAAALLLVVLAPAAGAAPAAKRALTLTRTPATVVAGSSVTFSGRLGHTPKGSAVQVQIRKGAKWTRVATVKTTTKAGAYKAKYAPTRLGALSFRAFAPARKGLKAATSKAVGLTVLARVAVTLQATPSSVTIGSPTSLHGTVKPFVAGTKVTLQHLTGSTWTTATTATVSATGGFAASVVPPGSSDRYRASVPRVGTKAAAVSGTVTVTSTAPPTPPTITTSALPDGIEGQTYSAALAAAGSPTGTWTASPLPSGVSVDPNTGVISGVPAGTGNTHVTIGFTQTDTGLSATPVTLTIHVDPASPVILTSSLPDAQVGTPYSAQLHVSGGVAGTWSVTGLAGGLSVDTATGIISGTPSSANVLSLTVGFTETSSGLAASQVGLSLTIGSQAPQAPVRVAAGGQFTCRTQADQTLWCWGYNDSGQLGINSPNGDSLPMSTPTQVGSASDWSGLTTGTNLLVNSRHACAIRGTDGYCWGSNTNDELGAPSVGGDSLVPIAITGSHAWSQLAAGWTSTCGVTTNGALYCWGDNTFGQLGMVSGSQAAPTRVGTDSTWSSVSVGYNFGCAVKAYGTLWCWGYNPRGQLGNGTRATAWAPTQVGTDSDWAQVSVGYGYACAQRTDGTLWCWGTSAGGALGNGVTVNDPASDALTPQQVGSASDWSGVSAGDGQTCAVNTGGQLWCWGANGHGQLGTGSTTTMATPTRIGTASDWAGVSAGDAHTCGVKTAGDLWCWGENNKGQLGSLSTNWNDVLDPTAVVG